MIPLRVLSYNVHGLRDDRAALTGLVRDLEPDVLIVQEGPRRFRWRHKCAALADDVGMVVARRWHAGAGQPAAGHAAGAGAQTWCLRYPLTPGRHLRGAAFARCSVRGAAFSLWVPTWPPIRSSARPGRAVEIGAREIEGPVIVGGDLNEGPGGGAWRTVADGFVEPSSAALTFPATLPRQRLDALFVSPDISVERYEVIESDQARTASDHLPVLADLLLPSS